MRRRTRKINRKQRLSRRKQKKQRGGGCVELEDREETIYKLKNILKHPEEIQGHNTPTEKDDGDYRILKYTNVPKGTLFLSRSNTNLLEKKQQLKHAMWADYTSSVGLPSYLVFDANSELAPLTRLLIGLYGPWLNTYETTRDMQVLHFPYNPNDPHGPNSYSPYCEDAIKHACGATWYWGQTPNKQCKDAYTMTFLPGSDIDRSPTSTAYSQYREIAVLDPEILKLINTEYAPLPKNIPALSKDEVLALRKVKDNIRKQSNYRARYGQFLLEVAAGEKTGIYARNKVVKISTNNTFQVPNQVPIKMSIEPNKKPIEPIKMSIEPNKIPIEPIKMSIEPNKKTD